MLAASKRGDQAQEHHQECNLLSTAQNTVIHCTNVSIFADQLASQNKQPAAASKQVLHSEPVFVLCERPGERVKARHHLLTSSFILLSADFKAECSFLNNAGAPRPLLCFMQYISAQGRRLQGSFYFQAGM